MTESSTLHSRDLALVATFAAFIAVCSLLPAINGAGAAVPFTLQMFGVFLSGAVLGAKRGALAVLLFLAAGTAGLPIFANGAAGPGVWAGASAGYLLAFVVAAFVVGLAAQAAARRHPRWLAVHVAIACAVVTIGVVAVLGSLGMARALDLSFREAWALATPFVLPDIAKGIAAGIVAAAVRRAFPQLLSGRSRSLRRQPD